MDENSNQAQLDRRLDEQDKDEIEAVELILFQVSECYVYMIPPRKSAASYRADEWDVNKWDWEGSLKVVSKGEECIIRLEDRTTGELYARAFLRNGEPHPVEAVIDSSRYFVLRVEENIGGRVRHAFIGIGFRERPQAYDFQAALYDHMKYLNKKKTAEEMEEHYQKASSVDYSLKEGETLVLQLKNQGSRGVKSAFFAQGLNNLSLDEKGKAKEGTICLRPPPPGPPSPVSPVQTSLFSSPKSSSPLQSSTHDTISATPSTTEAASDVSQSSVTQTNSQEAVDDDFGDFQVAG